MRKYFGALALLALPVAVYGSACTTTTTDNTDGGGGTDSGGKETSGGDDTGVQDTGTQDTGNQDTGTQDSGGDGGSCASQGQQCPACCDQAHPAGQQVFDKALMDCACADGGGDCATDCASTFCAGQKPDQTCDQCLANTLQTADGGPGSCTQSVGAACLPNPDCKALVDCLNTCP